MDRASKRGRLITVVCGSLEYLHPHLNLQANGFELTVQHLLVGGDLRWALGPVLYDLFVLQTAGRWSLSVGLWGCRSMVNSAIVFSLLPRDAFHGFKGGNCKLTATEKLRMTGLMEKTRVAVPVTAGKLREEHR